MNIAILGTGAIGGYYGALLSRSGENVHFFLRSDYDYVKKNGLSVKSVNGDFSLNPVNAYNDTKDIPPCELYIISIKTTSNNNLNTIVPENISPDATILFLQNGLNNENKIHELYPNNNILSGQCFICSYKSDPGTIVHQDYGKITFGEYKPYYMPTGITDKMFEIGKIFKKANIDVAFSKNLGLAKWQKLVWNIPFNGLTTILNCSTRAIVESESVGKIVKKVMQEVVNVANELGFPLSKEIIDTMIDNTKNMIDYFPSMKLDYESSKELELEYIYHQPLLLAKSVGISMPVTETIYNQLLFLSEQKKIVFNMLNSSKI